MENLAENYGGIFAGIALIVFILIGFYGAMESREESN